MTDDEKIVLTIDPEPAKYAGDEWLKREHDGTREGLMRYIEQSCIEGPAKKMNLDAFMSILDSIPPYEPDFVQVRTASTPDDEVWYIRNGETVIRRVKTDLYSEQVRKGKQP